MIRFEFEAIGTRWQVDLFDELTASQQAALLTQIKERLEAFDRNYSRFRQDSFIMKMAHQAGTFSLPEDARPLFSLYEDLYRLTDGAFTPLIGDVLVEAGYDADYSLKATPLHTPDSWDKVLTYDKNQNALKLKKPTTLDFGAGGKGYLIDLIGKLLEENHILSYCVDAGGDILFRSSPESGPQEPLRVGLENPENTNQVIGVATIKNQSICGSSGNRRKWGKFHHLINPHSLTSPHHILATWVIADQTILADALATCLFFVDPKKLTSQYNFEYVILNQDHSEETSKNFPAEFFFAQPESVNK